MRLVLFFILLFPLELWSQGLTADFSMKPNACIGEQLKITNLSGGAVSYEWDFCSGELDNQPNAVLFDQSLGVPFKVELIEVNGQYYGFYTVRGTHKLFRLDFGSDINSSPIKTDLGDLGLNDFGQIGWLNVEVVKDNDQFIGFILDYYNRIYRFQLGTDPKAVPQSAEVIYDGGLLSFPVDLAVPDELNSKAIFILNSEGGKLVRLNFDNSFNSTPNDITAHSIDIGFGLQGGISFVKDLNNWYAVISTFSGVLVKLFFDSGLFDSTPSISAISGIPFSPSYRGISVAHDGNNYYIFSQSPTNLYRVTLGPTMTSNPISSADLGTLDLLTGVWSFSMYKIKSDWLVFSTENSGANNIYRINFPELCFFSIKYSAEFEPTIKCINSGSGLISLVARDIDEQYSSGSNSISILSQTAPNVSFTSENICLNANINFLAKVLPFEISSYNWSFGDSQTSTDPNPTHQYPLAGDYTVKLNVTAQNGCNNFTEKTIKIYNPPSPSFTPPSGLICTNNEFTFTNGTLDNFDGNLTYQWQVDGQNAGTNRDLEYTFASTGDKNITLKTAIPGCTSEVTQVLNNVQAGPTVGFNVNGRCQNENINFVNTSSGSITSFSWDFGNSQTSNQTNPAFAYAAPGSYRVSLQSNGTNGCVSTTSKDVTIYSKPQTDFAIALPPFSCAGTPSQFNDLTPTMTDSNITGWQWTFGDAANTSAQIKNPTFLYASAGSYNVGLTTTTNFGCTNSTQKAVSILPPPTASFINGLTCLNQNVQFSNTSGADIKASQWRILGNTFNSLNPPLQRFTTPGTYPVQLTVTGNNNCQNQITRNITIQTPPSINYTIDAPCTDNITQFVNTSVGGTDPVGSIQWDILTETLTGQRAAFTFPTPGIYSVAMRYVGQSGCTYRLNRNVTIVNGPRALFEVSDDVGGSPLAVDFSNFSIPFDANFLWTFRKDATVIGTSTAPSPSYTFTSLGNYSAELTATTKDNCVGKKTLPIQVVVPEIRTRLSDFSLLTEPDGSRQASVSFENKSNVPVIDPEIILDVSGGALLKEKITGKFKPGQEITQQIGIRLVPRALNYVCAELVVSNDLEPLDNKLCISVSEEPTLFSPFPNPAKEAIKFEWISASTLPATARIYNTAGHLVFEQTWNDVIRGRNMISIETSEANLGDGLYVFTIQQGTTSQTFRVMVAKE